MHDSPLPSDLLGRVGRLLFGDRWKADMAAELKVSVDRVDDWSKGRGNPPPQGVWVEISGMIVQRKALIPGLERAVQEAAHQAWFDSALNVRRAASARTLGAGRERREGMSGNTRGGSVKAKIEAFVSGLEHAGRDPDHFECDYSIRAFSAFAQQLFDQAEADIELAATPKERRSRSDAANVTRYQTLTTVELRQRWNERRGS
jgi:hypothetical protein